MEIKKHKIFVLTAAYNQWYRDIVKYANITKEKYCEKHDYDYFCYDENVLQFEELNKRGFPWVKIYLLNHLFSINKECDYFFWIDADVEIINNNIKIEEFIKEEKDILISREYLKQTEFNTGFMLIKNNEVSRQFIKKVMNYPEIKDNQFHEQGVINKIHNQEKLDFLDFIEYENLYCYWSLFNKKYFGLHAARCTFDRLGFLYTLDIYCTVKMDEENEQQYRERMMFIHNQKKVDEFIKNCLKNRIRYRPSQRYKNIKNNLI